MANQNKFKVISLAIFMLLFSACNKHQNKEAEKETQKTTITSIDIENLKDEFIKRASDSIAAKNGYNKELMFYYENKCDSLTKLIGDVEIGMTPTGALEAEVFNAATPIIDKYCQKMNNLLDIYKLPSIEFSQYILNDLIMNGAYRDTGIDEDERDCKWVFDWEWNQIQQNLFAEGTSYGETRQQEIKNSLNCILEELKKELYASRKNIEKRYAKYIPGGQKTINRNCMIFSEGGACPGYEYFNFDAVVAERSVKVYDSKLQPEFFADIDAEYKLESVSKGKWRVVKTTKNGKKTYTHVFEHNTDFKTYENLVLNPICKKVGDCEFVATAGDNMGVHVYFSEVTAIEKAQEQYKAPEKLVAEHKRLSEELKKYEEPYKAEVQKIQKADSVARVMWQQKQANIIK